MNLFELFVLGIGLSFDTFAVFVSTGINARKIRFFQGMKIALVLAFFSL